jgi:hypothetical protein
MELHIDVTAIARRFATANIPVVLDEFQLSMVKMLKQEYLRMNAWPELGVRIFIKEFCRNIQNFDVSHNLPSLLQTRAFAL